MRRKISQRTKVVDIRSPIIWLLIVVAVVVVAVVLFAVLVLLPQRNAGQHYQANLAFETAEEWEAARQEYMQVIAMDASYNDTQVHLAEEKAKLAEVEAKLAELDVPTETPTAAAVEAPTPSPTETRSAAPTRAPASTPTDMAVIPLSDPAAPAVLGNEWSWVSGASESSSHCLSPEAGALTLITGPDTGLS